MNPIIWPAGYFSRRITEDEGFSLTKLSFPIDQGLLTARSLGK